MLQETTKLPTTDPKTDKPNKNLEEKPNNPTITKPTAEAISKMSAYLMTSVK